MTMRCGAIEFFRSALASLSASEASREKFSQAFSRFQDGSACLLSTSIRLAASHPDLFTSSGLKLLRGLHANGYQLCSRWLRPNHEAVQDCIGNRFFWLNRKASHYVLARKLQSIVSSQLGKGKHKLSYWPALLDWAVQIAARDQAALLLFEGTTLGTESLQFAEIARINCVEVKFPTQTNSDEQVGSVTHWLLERLKFSAGTSSSDSDSTAGESTSCNKAILEVSPAWYKTVEPNQAVVGVAEQDRLSFALADQVAVLHIRRAGTIAKLVDQRLADDRFPLASSFIALPISVSTAPQDYEATNQWLSKGAVGYLVPVEPAKKVQNIVKRPCQDHSVGLGTQQVCISLELFLRSRPNGTWNMLTHCTRANSSVWPQEAESSYVRRVWSSGEVITTDPFLMLLHILREARLRGSTWLTRGNTPMVSLSQVPLAELLARRTYRRHLNRWDWEHYGILFRCDALTRARPVTYGTEAEYQQMAVVERPFFQPLTGKHDWAQEREWRVPGDIDLRAIHSSDALVFTETRCEALQAALVSPFPVLWVEQTT